MTPQDAAAPAPTVPERVAVLGGGRMGAGIAHAFLLAGARVCVVERDSESAEAALERVESAISASERRGALPGGAAEVRARLSVTADRASLASAGLVIEAVPEDAALKHEALGAIAERVDPSAIIASNTSTMSIGALAAAVSRPERFLGLHFFNPVPASALVEIVVGPGTDPEVVAAAQGWVEALGKAPITVADVPGFASSRLGIAIGLEAIRMVEDGVASPEDIDRAMVLGYRHPMGPLRLTDLVGLDVRLGAAEYLAAELGPRFEPPRLMREMVAQGRLGRKSGQGFFTWED